MTGVEVVREWRSCESVFLRELLEAQKIYPCMSLPLAYWLNMESPSEESPNISFAMSMSKVGSYPIQGSSSLASVSESSMLESGNMSLIDNPVQRPPSSPLSSLASVSVSVSDSRLMISSCPPNNLLLSWVTLSSVEMERSGLAADSFPMSAVSSMVNA